MVKKLLDKFLQTILWTVMGFLATNCAVAGLLPLVDTCQNPEPPIITGTAKAICRNETVVLTATGCSGTVVWSNGDAGNSIHVQPQQTTKYTAICRARQGCISCFADVWKITVNTPEPPVINTSVSLVCPGDVVTLTAANCTGIVRWSNQTTGSIWTGSLSKTTVFTATCEQAGCVSNPSMNRAVQVAEPAVPIITASARDVCTGQSVHLTASGCVGIVRWSDGGEGITRSVTPYNTTIFRAICQIGSCRSDSSTATPIVVRPSAQKVIVSNTLTNGCPFQTADLTKALGSNSFTSINQYEFRTAATPDAPLVQSPGAVVAGTYSIFGRTADGCFTDPATVTVTIKACQNGIAPCVSNPATVSVRLDALDWSKGVVCLQGKLGGLASPASWQSSGGGLFTDSGLKARYLLSEADRQQGKAMFTLTVPDPDGDGPCVGASAQLAVRAPASSRELAGLSKKISEPVWISVGTARLVELTYQLTVVNLGSHPLTKIQVSDNLDAVFTSKGAGIRSTTVRADSGLVVNAAYTGRGADTTLLATDNQLPVGGQGHIWLTIQVDVSQASTLTFTNKAYVQALDVTGNSCYDASMNGASADPDLNGDPTDNNEPTSVTLQSLRPEETTTVFIPEGFSPNGDGINDRFVIQRVPVGTTVQLEIYNRWGNVVYRNADYKNDWDGTASLGLKIADSKQGLPDGTYYYQIRLSDGREFVRFLTLAR